MQNKIYGGSFDSAKIFFCFSSSQRFKWVGVCTFSGTKNIQKYHFQSRAQWHLLTVLLCFIHATSFWRYHQKPLKFAILSFSSYLMEIFISFCVSWRLPLNQIIRCVWLRLWLMSCWYALLLFSLPAHHFPSIWDLYYMISPVVAIC